MSRRVLIAAVSARPFVTAAAADGYTVLAMDVFADVDTELAAEQVFKIAYANTGFDAVQLEAALDQIDTSEMLGFAYGAGFEAQPDLLARISKRLPLLGNAPEVVRKLKDARYFFEVLDRLAIPHPELSFTALAFMSEGLESKGFESKGFESKDAESKGLATKGLESKGLESKKAESKQPEPKQPEPKHSESTAHAQEWICKEEGGAGGMFVQAAKAHPALASTQYYQRLVDGTPISVLFAANGSALKIIGFNQQWLAPRAEYPYRFGGIVGHVVLPLEIQQSLQEAAQKITAAFGLRGLNSLDVIWQGSQFWVLEINPRLSASLDLYASSSSQLFALHVQAVGGDLSHFPAIAQGSKARQVLYALRDVVIPEGFAWPKWTADIPMTPSKIMQHEPICTVLAEADQAIDAQALVLERADQLAALIFN